MLRNLEFSKRRWVVLLSFCLANLCTGSVYAWSVFAGPMAQRLSALTGTALGASDLSIVFTVYSGMAMLMMVVGGAMNARLSPRITLLLAGVFYGGGFLVSGFSTGVATLALGYGVMCNIGGCLCYTCTIGNAVKFFPDRRGLAGGMVTAFYGMSAVVMSPLINKLNTAAGVQGTFVTLGVIFMIVVCAVSRFTEKAPQAQDAGAASEQHDKTWRQMLADGKFYVMYFIMFSAGFFSYMVTSQAATMAQHIGMTVAAAAMTVSLLSATNATGRLVCGYLSDRLGRIKTLTMMLLVAILGLGMLIGAEGGSALLFCAGIICVGLAFGAFTGIFPGFTADQFGPRNNTLNYAIMFTSFSVAGMISPILSGKIYGARDSYVPAFWIAIGVCCVSLSLTFVYRALKKCRAAAGKF